MAQPPEFTETSEGSENTKSGENDIRQQSLDPETGREKIALLASRNALRNIPMAIYLRLSDSREDRC
jgi:hypothetical protein